MLKIDPKWGQTLRPILDINFDNTGDENRLKSPKIASFSFWIVVKFLGGSGVIEIDVQNGT